MKAVKPFLSFSLLVFSISIVFVAFSFYGIKLEFYVWEVLIDIRITAILIAAFYFAQRNHWGITLSALGLRKWNSRWNIAAFLFPLFLYAGVIIAGLALKSVHYAYLENTATLTIAVLFDIPAVFFFSFSTILIEEIVFRGIFFSLLKEKAPFKITFFVSMLLWTVYSFSGVLQLPEINVQSASYFLFFLISIGIASAILFHIYDSIWVSYSFRVGIAVFTPVLIQNYFHDADSFFISTNPLFMGDGLLVSFLCIASFLWLFWLKKPKTISLSTQK